MLIVEENKALKNPGFAQPAELDVSVYPDTFFFLMIKTEQVVLHGTVQFWLCLCYNTNCTTNYMLNSISRTVKNTTTKALGIWFVSLQHLLM